MRREVIVIKKASERGRSMAEASNRAQRNKRLASALGYCEEKNILCFVLTTHNLFSGVGHRLEIWHEKYSGTDRFAVYVDGELWRNGWSRTRFVSWLFKQIDSARRDWH